MKLPADMDATAVSEALLEATGSAMFAGDFETWADCFALPQTVATFDGQVLTSTREELRRIFDDVRAHFAAMGVDQMIRTCKAAAFVSDTQIEATHETHLLRRGQRVQHPYPVFSVLRCNDGDWQVADTQYAVTGPNAHSRALLHGRPTQTTRHSSTQGNEL